MASDSRSGRNQPQNEIVINAMAGETRVAVLEHGHFTELYIERESDRSVTGTVALGRVTRVLPGMQAAFVDIGLEKAAFLYAGDYLDEAAALAELGAEDDAPRSRRRRNGRNGSNGRQPPKIDTLLSEGQEIVVQVAKDPIGTKGARITSHVSVAGRHLVLTPWSQRVGVSRRIESDRERRRLREVLTRCRPKDLGFIVRTAGHGASDADLEADVRYLTAVWDDIQIRKEQVRAPAVLYSELSLAMRVIRDLASSRTKRIVVDDLEAYEEMKGFMDRFLADPKPNLERYQGSQPIFDHFGIESNIDTNLGKKVWLKSGGYLIIDQSEALTAIDVNTGRYVGKQNLEAVKEVVNQLRFRNIGGLIIIDLIDMETAENRDRVYRALQEALRQDKSKTNILKISELGLVEMTRKRTRENLVQQLCEPCSHCEGRGYVLSPESVAYKLLREIRNDMPRFRGRDVIVGVAPAVAEILLGRARKAVTRLSEELGRSIEVRARVGQHQEQFEVTAQGEGELVSSEIEWLAGTAPPEDAGPDVEDALVEAEEEALEAASAEPEGAAEAPESPGEEPEPEEKPAAAADSPGAEALPPAPAPVVAAPAGAPEMLDSEEESPILPRPEKQ